MKVYLLRLAIALAAALALYSLYVVFLVGFLPVLAEPLGIVEGAVFYTLLLRTLALTLVPKLRRLSPPLKMILYSFEMFAVVVCIAAFALTGDPGYFEVVSVIFPAWIAASFFILLPYFIFEFAVDLHKGERLLSALTWGALLLADSVFAGNLALGMRSLPLSLADLGRETISSVTKQPSLASLGSFSSPLVAGAGVLFYVSIVAYVALSQVDLTRYTGKYMFALLIMLIGNAALVGWTLLLVGLTSNMLWILTLPSVSLPLFLLVGFRGRKE